MLKELKFDEQQIKYIKKKIIAILVFAQHIMCSVNETKTGLAQSF
jgi:hypothetical protein